MKHRFTVLDIFRGIFASLVVFYHMSAFSDTPILNNSFIYNADVFVDFFFVLSGFVVCYSYQSIETLSDLKLFVKKRLYRLYPLHIILLLIFLIVEGIKIGMQNHIQINNSLENTPATFFSSLLLLNSIKMPGINNLSWNMVSWSISAEVISYLVFGITCLLLSKKYTKIKPFVYLIIALLSLLIIFTITGATKLNYTFDYGFLRGLTGFFIGTVCFYTFNLIYSELSQIRKSVFTILEIFILSLVLVAVVNGETLKSFGYIFEIIFFVAILIFAFEKGFISQILNKPTLLKNLGKYSYSIYMIHTLFISVFNVFFIRLLKLPNTAYSYLFLLNFLVVYLVASFTYQHIEMRFNYNKKKLKS
ncbi:acyltransferase [Pedobacter yonginense]|uniref:Acyltransferase n=1 Tax=Pedobacter yonginense TaxID=651869 RepID=A0A317ES11_9SPHI|nr:acyltransferase [Pedobacter yonginense]PWS29212.1 acyltransferase [Pedobacter yonginense]